MQLTTGGRKIMQFKGIGIGWDWWWGWTPGEERWEHFFWVGPIIIVFENVKLGAIFTETDNDDE